MKPLRIHAWASPGFWELGFFQRQDFTLQVNGSPKIDFKIVLKVPLMGISVESAEWLFFAMFPGGIGIWKCWFMWREENRSTRRKTLGARTRTNNKLNAHIMQRQGIKPGPHWWEASALTTGPSLLPICKAGIVIDKNRKFALKERPWATSIVRVGILDKRVSL